MFYHALALTQRDFLNILSIRTFESLAHPIVDLVIKVDDHIAFRYRQNIGSGGFIAMYITAVIYQKDKLNRIALSYYVPQPIVLRKKRANYAKLSVIALFRTRRKRRQER
jgi:hypothetical protein